MWCTFAYKSNIVSSTCHDNHFMMIYLKDGCPEKIFYGHKHKSILLDTYSHKVNKLKKKYLVISIDIIQCYFILFFYDFVCVPNYVYLGLCPSKYTSGCPIPLTYMLQRQHC